MRAERKAKIENPLVNDSTYEKKRERTETEQAEVASPSLSSGDES